MNHLSKPQRTERDALCARLHDTHAALEALLETYNTAVADAWEPVLDALAAYRNAVEDAKGWSEDIAAQIQEEIDGHNEKWQDSNRGQAFVQWQAEYDQADLEEIMLEKPEPLTLEIDDQSEALGNLPEDPK